MSAKAEVGGQEPFDPNATCAPRAISHNHQIFSDDDLALEILRCRGAPGIVADAVEGRDQMR